MSASRIARIEVHGFRGIGHAIVDFPKHGVIIGPNGCGKSTIIDALSLVMGQVRMVPQLTEHDFFGGSPTPSCRFRIVATLTGFPRNDPAYNQDWFRSGRAVEKWIDTNTGTVKAAKETDGDQLCAQVGLAARFDHEDLEVNTVRYFHDDDSMVDPFDDEAVTLVPGRLIKDVGYFVLPARRTWAGSMSFSSDLFRRTVANMGGVPAEAILARRDELRDPDRPLEAEDEMAELVGRLNKSIGQLMPGKPKLQLRLTSTDSAAVLNALVPHYLEEDGARVPAARHGTGLLAVQTFLLLLELARSRHDAGKAFILALEEPEIHVPPGLHGRLIGMAAALSTQTLCSTHSPLVAASHRSESVLVAERRSVKGPDDETISTLFTNPLSPPLPPETPNAIRKLFIDSKQAVVEALLYPGVLIPEGRIDYEWLKLLVRTTNSIEIGVTTDGPGFAASVGVIPTHDSNVTNTFEHLRKARSAGLCALVDGDEEGNTKATELVALDKAPSVVLQWPVDWTIEDVVGWIAEADEAAALAAVGSAELPGSPASVADLVVTLKTKTNDGGMKQDYLGYEGIAYGLAGVQACVRRISAVLDALCAAVRGDLEAAHLDKDDARSTPDTTVVRFVE